MISNESRIDKDLKNHGIHFESLKEREYQNGKSFTQKGTPYILEIFGQKQKFHFKIQIW